MAGAVLAGGAGLAAGAGAQQDIAGFARDPQRAAVAGVELAFVPDPVGDVPVLADLVAGPEVVRVRGDERGRFRIPTDRAGLLLATTENGLGALVERCWPGRGLRLELQPMAELKLEPEAPFVLWAAVGHRQGQRRHLPVAEGTSVRLPAGRYECWFAAGRTFGWREVELVSARRTTIALGTPVRTVPAPSASSIRPLGFPRVVVAAPGSTPAELLESAAGALFLGLPIDGVGRFELGSLPFGADAVTPPAGGDPWRTTVRGVPAGGAEAFVLRRTDRGTLRAEACARVAPDGLLQLPPSAGAGERWLLVTAAGCAPSCAPWSATATDGIRLDPGRFVDCEVHGPDGSPLGDVAVVFEGPGGAPATARGYTDDLGRARLGPIAGDGEVCVDDPRFLPAVESATAAAPERVQVQMRAGAALSGTVVLDGAPAPGVAVTLRDPRGRLRQGERTVLSDDRGAFSFTGLPDSAPLLLFAQRLRGGRTWSTSASARPGDRVELALRDEEPHITPPGLGRSER